MRRWLSLATILGVIGAAAPIVALLLAAMTRADAQSNHDRYHVGYVKWTNQRGSSCCNNQDCGEVEDRLGADGTTEVKVEGTWCPVEPWMRLKTGKSPNWETAHACVLQFTGYEFDVEDGEEMLSPCKRLICFAGRPGF